MKMKRISFEHIATTLIVGFLLGAKSEATLITPITTVINSTDSVTQIDPPATKLEKIEQFYLQQAAAKRQQNLWHFAWGDYCYVLYYNPINKLALQGIAQLAVKLQRENLARSYFAKALRYSANDSSILAMYENYLVNSTQHTSIYLNKQRRG